MIKRDEESAWGHLDLDIYGAAACIRSREAGVVRSLERDFSFFRGKGPCGGLSMTIRKNAALPEMNGNRGAWRPRNGRRLLYRDEGSCRHIRFAGRATCLYDYMRNSAAVFADEHEIAHEIAHYAVLSRLGEDLDARGLHRVHALGFSRGSQGALYLAPSGGGKSRLALAMLRRTKLGILSDDTPLLGSDMALRAFPLRFAFDARESLDDIPPGFKRTFPRLDFPTKHLVDIDFAADRIRPAAALSAIFLARPFIDGRTRILPASRWHAARALALHLVVGVGVPQMAEYMLNFRGRRPLRLGRILLRRLRVAARAALSIPAFWINPSRDPDECALSLDSFLAGLLSKDRAGAEPRRSWGNSCSAPRAGGNPSPASDKRA